MKKIIELFFKPTNKNPFVLYKKDAMKLYS